MSCSLRMRSIDGETEDLYNKGGRSITSDLASSDALGAHDSVDISGPEGQVKTIKAFGCGSRQFSRAGRPFATTEEFSNIW